MYYGRVIIKDFDRYEVSNKQDQQLITKDHNVAYLSNRRRTNERNQR